MPKKQNSPKEQERVDHHKDGSVRARGKTRDGVLTGYWEWFRKDGTKLRSGHFENGEQVGEWITYDQQGKPYKVTQMKPKVAAAAKKKASARRPAAAKKATAKRTVAKTKGSRSSRRSS